MIRVTIYSVWQDDSDTLVTITMNLRYITPRVVGLVVAAAFCPPSPRPYGLDAINSERGYGEMTNLSLWRTSASAPPAIAVILRRRFLWLHAMNLPQAQFVQTFIKTIDYNNNFRCTLNPTYVLSVLERSRETELSVRFARWRARLVVIITGVIPTHAG